VALNRTLNRERAFLNCHGYIEILNNPHLSDDAQDPAIFFLLKHCTAGRKRIHGLNIGADQEKSVQ
jgi:hypothetical protein